MMSLTERQIEAALNQIVEGLRKRDVAMATEPSVKDERYVLFDMMPPLSDHGWATLFKKTEDYVRLTDGPTLLQWRDKHIEVDRNLAFFRGIGSFDAKYKDGRVLKFEFRHTIVFSNIDGKWQIIHEHLSLPNASIDLEAPK